MNRIITVVAVICAVWAMPLIARQHNSIEIPSSQSYVVITSEHTAAHTDWKPVIDTLRQKHDASLIIFKDKLDEVIPPLSQIMPNYTCFVIPPDDLSRETIVTIHRLTRKLDEDPYTDTLWAVLTGYTAEDALRIATYSEPLRISRALGGTDIMPMEPFAEAIKYNESKAGGRKVKPLNGEVTDEDFPADSAPGLANDMNTYAPQLFMTSGHATTNDWQIGYTYRDGYFRCDNGQLIAKDTQGKRYDITSPNPKVFMPCGNCLIGRVDKKNCMALAMLHTGGVNQMFGYTAVTFFGYMGWGINDYFINQSGKYTLAQAFYFNNLSLVHELQTNHADIANANFDGYEHNDIRKNANKLQLRTRQQLGLLWDRDIVAFYGDPAWDVRLAKENHDWVYEFKSIDDKTVKLTITVKNDMSWPGRPIVLPLEKRISDMKLVSVSQEIKPLIADNFILLPLSGQMKQGDEVTVVYTANALPKRKTSAETDAITTIGTKD